MEKFVVTAKVIVSVNYDLSVEELLQKCNFHSFREDINSSNFQSIESGSKTLEFWIIEYRLPKTLESILQNLEARGLRPATLKELLSLAIKEPNLQVRRDIKGLGSSWTDQEGQQWAPCLCLDEHGTEEDPDWKALHLYMQHPKQQELMLLSYAVTPIVSM